MPNPVANPFPKRGAAPRRSAWLRGALVIAALLFTAVAAGAADGDPDEEEEAPLTSRDIPARIAQAQVGEWVLYRQANGNRLRLTVIEKLYEGDDTELVILNEVISAKGGKRPRGTREHVVVKDAVEELRDLGEEDRVTRGEVLLQGARLPVTVVHFIENGQTVRQSFFSPRIPVYGLARGVDQKDGKSRVALSLIDYGFADEILDE